MVIYKYSFSICDEFILEMPYGAVILSAFYQNNIPCLWAQVDPSRKLQKRKFMIFGTGHYIDTIYNLKHIATFPEFDGTLIWHLFEVI